MYTNNIKPSGNQSRQLDLTLSGASAPALSSTTVTSCCHCRHLALVLNELPKLERELNIIVRAIGGNAAMKPPISSGCHHESCRNCVQLTWDTFIPATGPYLVCCHCRSSHAPIERVRKNGRRGKSGEHFLAQPKNHKRYRYPAETCQKLLFEFPPDQEAAMSEIIKSINTGGKNDEREPK
jgi:hypothetical protein